MMHSIDLTGVRPRTSIGVLAAVAAVAITTALIYPLREVVPAVSTGVTYLIAVLLISTIWGLRLGLLTALLARSASTSSTSRRPAGCTIADGENWVALVVFFVAAAIASTLAELARSRAEEAELRRREADLAGRPGAAAARRCRARPGARRRSRRLAGAMGIELGRRRCRCRSGESPRCRRHPAGGRRRAGRRLLVPRGHRQRAARAAQRARRAGARGAPHSCGRASPARRRGRRGAGAPPQRRAQDRPAAGRLARPADSADVDRRGRRGARIGRHHRRGAGRAGRASSSRVDPAVATRRQAPRPLAARGGRGRSAARVVARSRRSSRRGGPDPRR